VRAGVRTQLAADALVRLDQHDAVVALDNGAHLALFDTRRIVAVVAHLGNVAHFDFGHLAAHQLGHTDPELARVRLGLGIRAPVVGHMLVLAGDLAAVATVAYR
jgi:hypothetical protein